MSHWILLTNFNCEPNTWHLYDSLFSESYLKSMKYILKTFSEINKEIDFFIILHRDVQRQKGPNSSNPTHLINPRDLKDLQIDQSH